ncbi:MAG: NADH-quinone oxidoreductase subunit NuoH [Candidatus Eiseniibacteriota bacterium]|jgi:NADH-quinone oxidoreductase subunit H
MLDALGTLGGMVTKVSIVLGVLLGMVAYTVWLERKVLGHIQTRRGPLYVGFHGLLQPIADGIKLFVKEDVIPDGADRVLFAIAPAITVGTALIAVAVIPFGETLTLFGHTIEMHIADLNIGILYILAVTSLGVYGLILGGWSSNNKFALLGSLRSSAQMISYELALGFTLIGPLMLAGTLRMRGIVEAQQDLWFVVLQPLGFVLYLICALAETNRVPFDLPEAESEIVAGYHVEYSGMKFAFFFLGEYANMITVAAIATTVFLGGWQGLFGLDQAALAPLWFLGKVALLLFLFIWIRGTLPRFRFDQLMGFGWKVLIPLALANVLATGVAVILLGG